MAELSPETEAIIQRLKDEGQLVRNSGTNSLRSVKIELVKFQDIFNTISTNVVEQTRMMQMQSGVAQEALEVQRSKDQFDELQTEKNDEGYKDIDGKIDKVGDRIDKSISNALTFKGALGGLKDLAMVAGGLFVGYNLVKGFINERTNGGFDRMEEGIANFDFSGITNLPATLASLNTTLGELGSSLSSIATSMAGLGPLAEGLLTRLDEIVGAYFWKSILLAGAGLATALITARNRVGTLPGLPGGGPAGGPGGGPGKGSFLGRLGGSLGNVLRTVAPFARVVGGAVAIGTVLQLDAENQQAMAEGGLAAVEALKEQRQNNMMDWFESTPGLSQLISGYNSLYEMVHGEPPPRTTYDAQRLAQSKAEEDAMAQSLIADEQAAENARIAGLSNEDYQIESLQEEIGYLQGEINKLNSMSSPGVEHPLISGYRNQINDLQSELNVLRPQTPLQFQGSGRGSIIEGPNERKNYLDGQLLDSYIAQAADDIARSSVQQTLQFEELKLELERFIDTLESGASGTGGAVIINAPTSVSPVINNMGGNKSVNQLSLRTGGGGGGFGFGGANAYGLSGFLN